jgi:hypothetical protein
MVQRYLRAAESRRRGQQQNTSGMFFPPSQSGLNVLNLAADAPVTAALELLNMVPEEYGTAVRKGYAEWCDPIPLGDGVKTIIPYNGATAKTFAATSDGIYEITEGGTPSKVFNFTIKSALAGWCSWHFYRTVAGTFMLVSDLANGYVIYNGGTDSWAAGSVTGPTAPLVHVSVWKNRVWLVEQGTGLGWYLPVGQITGAAQSFNFGTKFKYGGTLRAIYNWTIDGGEGIDDYLVAVSTAGDLVVYRGTDPNSATTFGMVGYYWIGKPPENNRLASDFGGELLLLSGYGIIQFSRLLKGLPVTDEEVSLSSWINPRISDVLGASGSEYGWEVKAYPREQLLFVSTPKKVAAPHMQFVYHTGTRAWCQFVDVPYLTGENVGEDFLIGTADNRVYKYTGHVDNVQLGEDPEPPIAINWAFLTTFQSMGEAAKFKRVHFFRPMFISGEVPNFIVEARYDFDLSQINTAPTGGLASTSLWGSGLWGSAIWGGGNVSEQSIKGATGLGRHVAIAMRGRSSTKTVYVGSNIMGDAGGLL